ncbi:MAG: hypothetical protein R2771_02500 [Saprospiraceae bacterium]
MALKLTGFSKILLVLAIMIILFFVGRKYIPGLNNDSNENKSTTNTEQVTNSTSDDNAKSTSNGSTKTFDYSAPVPVNGTLKGVVELGASGFNSFIVNIDRSKNWKLEKAEWGNSLVYDKMATSDDIRDGLKRYIGKIFDFGVSSKNIHFVVSSGAQKVESTAKIIGELKKMGYVVNTVTPEQEAKYALKSVLPLSYAGSAFVVDIGSGNTKISWIDADGNSQGIETYGAKYYVNNVQDNTVTADVKSKASKIPNQKTNTCFIIGGVPYQMADEVRIGDERYTVLRDPSFYKDDGAKMKSGKIIYQAIKDATGCDMFVFDWDSNFTIGFLLSL